MDYNSENLDNAQQPSSSAQASEQPARRPRQRIMRAEKVVPQKRSEGFGGNHESRPYQQRPRQPRPYGYNNRDEERPHRPYGHSAFHGERPHRPYNNYVNVNHDGEHYQRPYGYSRDEEHGYQSQERPYHNTEHSYHHADRPYRHSVERPYNDSERPYGMERPMRYPHHSDGEFSRPSEGFAGPRPNRPSRPKPSGKAKGAKFKKKGMIIPMTPTPSEVVKYKDNIDPMQPIRLNRYLSNAGVCSRREADVLISQGLVEVNGTVVTELGHRVCRTDRVLCRGKEVDLEDKVYVLLNKPKGFVTTNDDPENRKKVIDLVRNACAERIYPVGRLDRNTTGVLLLTNDGEMASKLMHPKFLKKKIYHVWLDRNVAPEDMEAMRQGVELSDGEIHADAVEYVDEEDKKQVGVEIHSGRNRIIRRIFEHLNYKVRKLDRVYFAGLTKRNLKRGQWRYLTDEEVRILRMGSYE